MNLMEKVKESTMVTSIMNESQYKIGNTSMFEGNDFMGSHHHEYILWSPQLGWGKTGDAIANTEVDGILIAHGHEHMIVDGVVLEVYGHTHTLEQGDIRFKTDLPKAGVTTISKDHSPSRPTTKTKDQKKKGDKKK